MIYLLMDLFGTSLLETWRALKFVIFCSLIRTYFSLQNRISKSIFLIAWEILFISFVLSYRVRRLGTFIFFSSLNGFKFLYLEAVPLGNEESLSLLAMWIPVNSLIQDESNLHSSNAELCCVPPTLVISQLLSLLSGMSFPSC